MYTNICKIFVSIKIETCKNNISVILFLLQKSIRFEYLYLLCAGNVKMIMHFFIYILQITKL